MSYAAKSSELAEMLEELDVQPMPAAWKGRKHVGVSINGIVLVYNGLYWIIMDYNRLYWIINE